MRKITREAAKALIENRDYTNGNTLVRNGRLFLHFNPIICKDESGNYAATMAGWGTATTRERLNGACELLGLQERFRQCAGLQYFGDAQIGSCDTVYLTPNSVEAG